jgi:acetamidase/formamidase
MQHRSGLAALGAAMCALGAAAPAPASGSPVPPNRIDAFIPSRPETLVLGGFPIGDPPVKTIRSGDLVRIDALSQQGITSPNTTPTEYFAPFGIQPSEILKDMTDFQANLANEPRYGGHVLTGPVYVRGAEPGDTIEIQILDLDTRVNYGTNSTSPTSGVFATTYPGYRVGDPPLDIPASPTGGTYPDVRQHVYRTGPWRGREVAWFRPDMPLPLQPFFGVMGVAPETGKFVGNTEDAPPPATGVQSSTQPGPYGGNLDVHDLTVGSTLYLPVFQPGAQMFFGDTHTLQGNGEVSGTAIEQSLSGTFRFILHKGVAIDGPVAEDGRNLIFMGIDWDLDRAMKFATQKMIDYLVSAHGFTVAKAYSFASLVGDFQVGEVVDRTQVVTGKIDKRLLPPRRGNSFL